MLIWLSRQLVSNTTTIPTINTSAYEQLWNATEQFDFAAFLKASLNPYLAVLGSLFFVFAYGIPFISMWLRQSESVIPTVLGLILAGFIIPFLPEEYRLPAFAMLALSVFGVIYIMVRGR